MKTAGWFEISKAGSETDHLTQRAELGPSPQKHARGVCVHMKFCGLHTESSGCKQLPTWIGNAGVAEVWVDF